MVPNTCQLACRCVVRYSHELYSNHSRTVWGCMVVFLLYLYFVGPVVLWVFSGIVSSIGLGTGLNTGILHLMPYQAQMAFQHGPRLGFLHSLLPTLHHAFGSALGELPPFLFQQSVLRRLPPSVLLQINRLVPYVRTYGTKIVFVFAVWPSAFFDMCGITASLVQLPAIPFLLATIAGKSLKSVILCYLVTHQATVWLPGGDLTTLTACAQTLLAIATAWMVNVGVCDLAQAQKDYDLL